MNHHDIVEKKEIRAKEEAKDINFSISPEDSKAVYLKKCAAAKEGAADLGDLSLTGDNGQVVASSVADKKIIAKKIEDAKIIDAKLDKENVGDMDFGVDKDDYKYDDMKFEAKDDLWYDAEELDVDEADYEPQSSGNWFQDIANSAYETGIIAGKIVADLY
jgi:hypothetical protein